MGPRDAVADQRRQAKVKGGHAYSLRHIPVPRRSLIEMMHRVAVRQEHQQKKKHKKTVDMQRACSSSQTTILMKQIDVCTPCVATTSSPPLS